METFSWQVISNEFSEKTEFAVREVQFGEGYTQIQPLSINNKKREITAAIVGDKAMIEQIVAFFNRHSGVKAFWFQGIAMRVQSFQKSSMGGNVFRISFTLKEK